MMKMNQQLDAFQLEIGRLVRRFQFEFDLSDDSMGQILHDSGLELAGMLEEEEAPGAEAGARQASPVLAVAEAIPAGRKVVRIVSGPQAGERLELPWAPVMDSQARFVLSLPDRQFLLLRMADGRWQAREVNLS